jgi:enterochelin esterase-like enzyme
MKANCAVSTLLVSFVLVCLTTEVCSQGLRPLPIRIDPRSQISSRRLELVTLSDSVYHMSRRVWVHTPLGYNPKDTLVYPMIVAFDGPEYRDTIPLPMILDTLRATGKAPAFIAVLIDDFEGAARIRDLGNAAKMVDFLARQLLPYVRTHWRVTTNPKRVIVTGSSAGGLGAAFVALQRPDLFGNVLSQSGAFWRGAEASNRPPYEWLTSHVMQIPKRDINFFLDVGEFEDHLTLGGTGPNFLEANRRFRDALKHKGYSLTYTEVLGGQHGPPYWMSRLPVGIVALSSGWR